jgi:glycerol-3-phosphate dehydrogenase
MLNVAGGKLTTYRKIALQALGRLRSELGVARIDGRPWPLPGAAGLEGTSLEADLEPDVRDHLLHLYGSRAADVLAAADRDPALVERIHPDGPDVLAQVAYAAEHEWARSAEDVLRRRTTCFVRGLADDDARRRVDAVLAGRLVP